MMQYFETILKVGNKSAYFSVTKTENYGSNNVGIFIPLCIY